MKSFEIKFDTENAAFDDVYLQHEIASILRRVALLVEEGQLGGNILDTNGNTVGTFQAMNTSPEKRNPAPDYDADEPEDVGSFGSI